VVKTSVRKVIAAASIALLASCERGPGASAPELAFEAIPRPIIASFARDPELAVLPSGVILALLATPGAEAGHDLYLYRSVTGADSFGEPVRVNRVAGAARPHREGAARLLVGKRGDYYVVWTSAEPDGGRTGIKLSRSLDFGHSFEPPVAVDGNGLESHPFFNAALSPEGEIAVVWLGYDRPAESLAGTATLMLATSTDGGASFSAPRRVAMNVCPCCRPALALGPQGRWHIAWRGVEAMQVRDIVAASSRDGGRSWSDPVSIGSDGWKIAGCPESGPSLALRNGRLYVAWYTAADDHPRIKVAHSTDAGVSFSEARVVSGDVFAPNHPSLALAGNRLLVSFQGRDPDAGRGWSAGATFVSDLDGSDRQPLMAPRGPGSATYPTISSIGPRELIVAWTDIGEDGVRALAVRARMHGASPEAAFQ
jgi:hypothetical protein